MTEKIEKTLKDHLKVFIFLLIILAVVFSIFSKGPFKFDVEEISGSAVKEVPKDISIPTTMFYFILVIGIVLAFFYKDEIACVFSEKGNYEKHLDNYINNARSQGFSDHKIKERLLEQGWDIIDIDTTFSRMNKNK